MVGVGFGANMVIACVYPLEFVGRQWRVLSGTIGFWSLGSMALAGFVSIVHVSIKRLIRDYWCLQTPVSM